MKELTTRQQEVLTFIADYIYSHAYPPTIREIGEHFSISIKGAHDHVNALKKKGILQQGDKRSRTIIIVKEDAVENSEFIEVPILGTVAAGKPILADENKDGSVKLHRRMLKEKSVYFALKVRGDSMEGAGIMDGDTAIIEQRNAVKNGQIAVVMLDDAVTLKTFYKESSRIRLQAENPNYSPIYCTKNVRILGKLAHIIRSYS